MERDSGPASSHIAGELTKFLELSMISPHTPPGTKVVCIGQTGEENKHLPALKVGDVYTLDRIEDGFTSPDGFGVYLCEIVHPESIEPAGIYSWAYGLADFRRLELPSCLTELLDRVPENV